MARIKSKVACTIARNHGRYVVIVDDADELELFGDSTEPSASVVTTYTFDVGLIYDLCNVLNIICTF